MSVGKGSIVRAAQASEAGKGTAPVAASVIAAPAEKVAEMATAKPAAKTAAKPAKTAKTAKPAVRASVISSSDSIHEKKFEAVSHIYSDLPVYLL